MSRVDIAIIGTGPAGVSAALTAKNRNKSILLLGSKSGSNKVSKSHLILNYPGLPSITGEDLSKAFAKQLEEMDIPVTDERVSTIYSMGDYFAIQAGENMYEASTVILASGVVQGKTLPGEDAMLGRGVSYCATCDAALYRGRTAAVIGYSPKEEEEAAFLSEVAEQVLYFPQYPGDVNLPEKVTVYHEAPESLSYVDEKNPGNGVCLTTKEGNSYTTNGIFVLRDSIAPSQLMPGIAVDGAHIQVDRSMATNLPGCFAAGDITGLPYQDAKSVGEGNVAALSAAAYLDNKKREQNNA